MCAVSENSEPHYSCQLTAPARPGSIEAVHDLIASLWTRQPQLSDLDRIRFEAAVIEVAANIVEHTTVALYGALEVTIELTLVAGPERITAQFRDDGNAADVDLSSAGMPDEMAENGRGLALARAMTDEVTYQRAGARNVWTLTCLRSDPEPGTAAPLGNAGSDTE